MYGIYVNIYMYFTISSRTSEVVGSICTFIKVYSI